jgi:RNA polymerase sigma-70 factor (ECF subfamily)
LKDNSRDTEEKLKSGDIEAYKVMFHQYYPHLVRYCNTIVRDIDDSEDIVQEVFVNFWEKRESINVHTSLKSMLYTAVYNAGLNHIKHRKVITSFAQDAAKAGDISGNADEMIHDELRLKIENAIEQMPEQCGKIFRMSREDELKYREIADKLNLSVKTVENQMGKALAIMREHLKEYLTLLIFILQMN